MNSLPCPDCAAPLADHPIGRHLLRSCVDCHGVWIDRHEAIELSSTIRYGASYAGPSQREKPLRVRHCARCDGAAMAVVRYRGHEVDVCSSCKGIWLDEDALAPIVARHGLTPKRRERPASSNVWAPPRSSMFLETMIAFPPDPFLLHGVAEVASAGADGAAEIGGAVLELIAGIVASW